MHTAYLRDFDGRVTSLSHFTSSSLAGYTSIYDAANRITSTSRVGQAPRA
jgi:hypothetical protein